MGGQYLNRIMYKAIIQNWINEAINKRYWENFHEIHIDEIGTDFKKEQYWLEGAFFILNIFKECLNDNYKVLLIIELNYNYESVNLDKLDWKYLEKNISSDTPPSFYLFPVNDSRLIGTLKELIAISNFNEKNIKSYFKEEYDEEEYLATIYFLN